MCGIAGWVDFAHDLTCSQDIVEGMTRRLAHRGPDAEGFWFSPRALLGHRRLVVIDPEGGLQPMVRGEDGFRFVIVYNGELYNTADLRRELEARGVAFQTKNSDTEVLLAAFMAWGAKCLERLNGIYSFAVWDEARECLLLARDRLGVKPLFFAHRGSSLVFGSEIKALLAHPSIEPRVNSDGLAEVLIMGPSHTPGHGVFAGINELKPGTCLEFSRQGLKESRYWTLCSHLHPDDVPATLHRVRELVTDAVRRQTISDVPICTLLSGGLDSGIISAVAAAECGNNLQTFSVDYEDSARHFSSSVFEPESDQYWTGRLSTFLGTDHHSIVLRNADLASALPAAMRANDGPGMADIDTSLLLFSQKIKEKATVALSGECADEIFGGYPWFFQENSLMANEFLWIRSADTRSALLSREVRDWIRPLQYLEERYYEAVAEVPHLPGEDPIQARRRQLFYLNLTRFMPTLLTRKDRMSMACGLEVRVPFADHRIVEYVWNVPWEMKTLGGRAKGLLREAFRGLLPDDALERRKTPYPRTHNPAYHEACRRQLLDILADGTSPLHLIFDTQCLKAAVLKRQQIFGQPWFGQLMGDAQYMAYLIQLHCWLTEYRVFF